MTVERIGDALILQVGSGEWYNEPSRGIWDMGEDAAPLPPARWHTEVEAAIRSQNSRPAVLVIDTTELTFLVMHDFGFLLRLSSQLMPLGIELRIVARPHVRCAYAIMRKGRLPAGLEYFDMVGTLEEGMRQQ